MNKNEIIIARIEKACQRVRQSITRESIGFDLAIWKSHDPVPFSEILPDRFSSINPGETWGSAWENAWFHLTAIVPKSWSGLTIVAELDFGGEGLVYDSSGRELQGIATASIFNLDYSRTRVHLLDACSGGEPVDLWVDAVGNGLFGVRIDQDPSETSPSRYGSYEARVACARLCVFDPESWNYYLDLRVTGGIIRRLPESSVRRARLIRAASESLDCYCDNPDYSAPADRILLAELKKPACASALEVTAIGHAHIDTAWLWPVSETVRKCARTFASQLDLLDRYPDYVFGASQPQLYQFMKDRYPAIYQRIRDAVQQGRWEIQGGMWVEADCNLTSGESLVRQILHGKNFFMDEFGINVRTVWLPDAFGFTPALPQIMLRSGIPYFLTQKISWNQVNEFPFHTFRWRGIDGSEVLAHFPPENNYNSELDPSILIPAQDRYTEKDICTRFISLYGVGDGGGGPKEDHIELGRRMTDLEGTPRVRFEHAIEGFHALDADKDRLPVWDGELYLELHRGTLTTQARIKHDNRRLENRLVALEFLASMLPLTDYPDARFDELWKTLLLHQFHDILPGSSIPKVYSEAHLAFEAAFAKCDSIQSELAARLFRVDPESVAIMNILHDPFEGTIRLPDHWNGFSASTDADVELPVQKEGDAWMARVSIPPYSFVTLRRKMRISDSSETVPGEKLVLDNGIARYEFSKNAELISALDLETGQTVLQRDEMGNLLTLFEDRPNQWDAWDIDFFYEKAVTDRARGIRSEMVCQGPVRTGIRFELEIGRSRIVQLVYLDEGSRRLDFDTEIDWQEKHRMLRVSFPVAVRSDRASFDIQYGYVTRNTHRNTSWDRAKFEVAAQRYCDLSDANRGVALLNDGKYGCKVHENVLDLNLLRSPTYPDPDADRGKQHFVYSLYPHKGNLVESDVIAQAAALNQRPVMFVNYSADGLLFPWRLEGNGVSLAIVKRAEKEPCHVMRIVETHGRHSKGRLLISDPAVRLVETDLMEWVNGMSAGCGPSIDLTLTPFEIRTYKF